MSTLGYALDCLIVELERTTCRKKRRQLRRAIRAIEDAAMPRKRWWQR